MPLSIRFVNLEAGTKNATGQDMTVHYVIKSELGEITLSCPDRYQPGENLNDVIERTRQHLLRFADALKDAAKNPFYGPTAR